MVLIKDILNYSVEEWELNQALIIERVVDTRERLGLDEEWVAGQAGYSVAQYRRFEAGERFLDIEDFFRISEVFYRHQETLLPSHQQKFNKLTLYLKILPHRIMDWVLDAWDWIRGC